MDYNKLAAELLEKGQAMHKAGHIKGVNFNMDGEVFVLCFINEHCRDTILPKAISDAMGVSSARVAVILNDLENKELITREIDKNDRRNIVVKLTMSGRDAAEKHKRKFVQKITVLLKMMGEHDAREYVRIMGKLAEVISSCSFQTDGTDIPECYTHK